MGTLSGSSGESDVHTKRLVVRTLSVRHPRTRAWVGALFVAGNVALTMPFALFAANWYWPGFHDWFQHLNLDSEQSAANWYASGLWATVAALAAAQVVNSPPAVSRLRWLRSLGWIAVALFAALVAWEEAASIKDTARQWEQSEALLARLNLADLPTGIRWAATVTVLAAPLAALSGWTLCSSLRHKPALLLLTALAIAIGLGAILRDGFGVLYGTTHWWGTYLDDASEIMTGAILAVVFFEALVTRHTASVDGWRRQRNPIERWAAFGVTLAVVVASVPALLAEYEWEEAGWMRPNGYAGPISRFEQPLQVHLGDLTALDVWGYAEDADGKGEPATILVSLLPSQGGRPAWARAVVRGNRSSPAINRIAFQRVPGRPGDKYDLVIFSEPLPRVHLGLMGDGAGPHGDVLVNGVPHERQLAAGIYSIGTGAQIVQDLLVRDPRRLFLIGDIVLTAYVWLFVATVVWRGLTGPPSRFWRGSFWPSVRVSALMLAGLMVIALVVLPFAFGYAAPENLGVGCC